ncbi:MAG: helicase-related protein [Candidatus Omnitrophota bacterium]
MENLLPGAEVATRGLRWEIVYSERLGQQILYRLRGLEGSFKNHEFDLLSPFEEMEPVIRDLCPERAAPLGNWLIYHQAFLLEQSLGPKALLSVQPGRLRMEPYQLVPVLRALQMSRVRLLLADGVGLGKTIQAGLILTELMARRIAHRILVVSPAGLLLEQWKTEMSERFGLRLIVVDREKLEEIRKETELGANPFDFIPLGLVSLDFLKQERILEQLERTSYDVIIIDEAHHCMDVGSHPVWEDSQRRRLAEILARQCDSLLLLTATPHDGNDRSFASLCELLDPSLVDGRGALRGERYREHVVRRLKVHIHGLFKQREVFPCPVTALPANSPNFIKLNKALLELIGPELRRSFRERRYDNALAYISLLKRSVSTVEACKSTLQVVAERFQSLLAEKADMQEIRRQRLKTLREYHRKLERFGVISPEEEEEKQLLEAEDLAQQLAELQKEVRSGSRQLTKVANVVEALDNLASLTEKAVEEDPKLWRLVEEIHKIRSNEARANILIYTEYTTSQDAVVRFLKKSKFGDVITLKGDDPEKDRRINTERFRTSDNLILVSTDAAAEGLNLHQRCHNLIHLELPFNPNRLEQRNGRIDRYGQEQNPIVRYLYLRGSFEERILLRLIAKYERQRARLTFVPNTLGISSGIDAGNERLLKGLLEEESRLFKEEETLFDFNSGQENEGADDATREILEEIDRSLNHYEKASRAHVWLGDAGLHAEQQQMEDAENARIQGQRVGINDLARFVIDAVLLDGGDTQGNVENETFQLVLPPSWHYGLDDLPGYDSASRCVRLTTNLEVTKDSEERAVGFLGRAHPLVQRSLERVRHLSYGGAAHQGLDPRVSAVKADVEQPCLLFTNLGRISSRAGRELEQVVAVKISQGTIPDVFLSAEEWLSWAEKAKAVNTADIWKNYFAAWAEGLNEPSRQAALDKFQPIAREFIEHRKKMLEEEKKQQEDWLRQRAIEITGASTPQPVQLSLFDQETQNEMLSSWASLPSPHERLAAFAADSSQPIAKRSEADGVLRIYAKRMADLDARLQKSEPEMIPIGILLLIPEAGHAA